MKKRAAIILVLGCAASAAFSQNSFPTPTGRVDLAYPGGNGQQLITVNQAGIWGAEIGAFNNETLFTLRNGSNWTPTVVLRSGYHSYINGGNLGVGTQTPTAKLEVAGGAILAQQTVYVRHIEGKEWNDASTVGDLYLQHSNSGGNVLVNGGKFVFRGSTGILYFGSDVPGIEKKPTSRFDIGPLGGTTADNPFWRGVHFSGPAVTKNGIPEWPRLSLYQESATLTNPDTIAYVLETGNTTIPTSIYLRPGSGGKVVLAGDTTVSGRITNGGSDFYLGTNDGRNQGAQLLNRALVHSDTALGVDSLVINYDGDFEGGVDIMGPKVVLRGNVGIGTVTPTEKLSVNGRIRAREVIVETAGWSDYVFDDDYQLASLPQVEEHIRRHKHLPGVPSASRVATEGVSVGEMQATLLAKIEELTLHAIAQQKMLETQARRLESQQQEIAELRARIR